MSLARPTAGRLTRCPPSARVLLFAGKVEGEPVQTCKIRFQDGGGSFAGFKPGKYTLWFDFRCELQPAAPLVLEDVELGEGSTDLGELKFSDGASVRVKIQVAEGKEFPRLNVSARSGREARVLSQRLLDELGRGRRARARAGQVQDLDPRGGLPLQAAGAGGGVDRVRRDPAAIDLR